MKKFLLPLIFLWAYSSINATVPAQKIAEHRERLIKDSIPFSNSYIAELGKIEAWLKNQPVLSEQGEMHFLLLDKYLGYLNKGTFRKYVSGMHDDIISKSLEILQVSNKGEVSMPQWVNSLLPEYYAAVKVLIPADIARDAVLTMARERPQELINQFSWLDYSNNSDDLLQAMTLAPHLFSQFMHYNNSVKKVLTASKDPNILLMFDIYAKYRFSNNAYYLLPFIANKSLTIDQAEKIAAEEHLLINYLTISMADTMLLSSNSIKERWGELTGKYLKQIKYDKNIPVNEWKMGALEKASDTTRIMMLLMTHSLLTPMELEAFMRWISLRHFLKPLPSEYLDKISLSSIIQLKARVEEEKLTVAWGRLWGADSLKSYIRHRREQLTPSQLSTLQNQLSQTKGVSFAIPAKPKEPEFIIQTYYFNLSNEEKAFIRWKNDPLTALDHIKEWIDARYADKLLQEIATKYPLELVKHQTDIQLKTYGIEALKTVGKQAPQSAKNYIIQPGHPWNLLFKTSTDSIIKLLYRIDKEAGINTRAYLLLDPISKGKISIYDADSLCKQPGKLVRQLIDIASNPNALGRYSVEQELSAKALKFVRNLNISENTDHYFDEELKSLSDKELFTFMTYGEDEIIESNFRKMLNELLSSIPNGNIFPLMESLGFNQYLKFLRKCAFYNLSDRVYTQMTTEQKRSLTIRMLNQLEFSSEANAVLLADFIVSLDDKSITDLMHQQLKIEYERCEKARLDKGVAIYGVLSSLLSTKVDKGWAKFVAEKYELPSLNFIPAYELFNKQMSNIQQYFFYNDEDGISSYNNFIRSYEKSSLEWEIKDFGSFILIRSKSGRNVEIYANKAREGENGIEAMLEHMKKNKLEPIVVVHRGLSTHTLKTFVRIPKSVRLILDGSCGGYHVQQVAIDRAPSAQILCNRNVGTMHINDPMFKQISEDIRTGKDIIWPEFWTKMNTRMGTNPYFKDYIPPHKNSAAILLKALYDVLEIN